MKKEMEVKLEKGATPYLTDYVRIENGNGVAVEITEMQGGIRIKRVDWHEYCQNYFNDDRNIITFSDQ